jgi:hypothetical protein
MRINLNIGISTLILGDTVTKKRVPSPIFKLILINGPIFFQIQIKN